MECYVPEALMEQPLPQPQPQLLPLPRPREGLQEDQMSGPLPPRLRLLEVHRVQTDRPPGASGSDGGSPGAAAVDVGSG